MQIHVVNQGESLFGIAQAYSTRVEDLVRANEIPDPSRLVVGQALVIPIVGMFYWVRPGDSLYSIGQRLGVSYLQLAQINQLSLETPLPVGLRLYIPPRPRVRAETNAYVEPRGTEVSEALLQDSRRAAPYLTYLAPFSYELQRDGSLKGPPLGELPSIAAAQGATLMMVVTNLEGGQFSAELGSIILNDEELQNRLLDEILRIAREVGYRDIHFDFEFLPPEDRGAYNRFLRKAAERIRAEGYLISTALAPKTRADQPGQWYEAHDYRAHGRLLILLC